ncbi:hypothetical protein [Microbacterium paraoxydans]|nr:hypothetical protein [Microbacterium paraoxydans]
MTIGPVERLLRYSYAGQPVAVPPAKMTKIIRKALRSIGFARTVQLIDALRRGAISQQQLRVLTHTGIPDPTGELAAQRVDFMRALH